MVSQTVDPVSKADSCEEDLELIDRAEDTVDNYTNAAGDMDIQGVLQMAMTVELTMSVMQTVTLKKDE